MRRSISFIILIILCLGLKANSGIPDAYAKIDRHAVVCRNNPHFTSVDTLGALTVGNGHFAFTVDVTGLQTFPKNYATGIPLGTMSDWGWHSFPNEEGFKPEEALQAKDFGRGHEEVYAVEFRKEGRERDASNYFRQNPHRLHLGCLGFDFNDIGKITDISQTLDMWNGLIDSRFKYDDRGYHVQTVCSPSRDKIAMKVETKGKIGICFRIPYPTGKHSDDGCDWSPEGPQNAEMYVRGNSAVLKVIVDKTSYQVRFNWRGRAKASMADPHTMMICGKNHMELTVEFIDGYAEDGTGNAIYSNQKSRLLESSDKTDSQSFDVVRELSSNFWSDYWNSGGMVDFSHVNDSRASELERRVVLSQYLMRVNDAGDTPPQETGLTYNSWFGKFHLEMIWWHQVQFALWGHPELLERSLKWYIKVAPKARDIACRQGFDGLRWMKMTDPNGGEAPSNVGSFLIWQQPHFIYLAELLYRCQCDDAGRSRVTSQYKGLVDETARFMYSFASFDSIRNRYELKGCIPAQETLRADSTVNPPFELSYWHWGLQAAQKWRERAGQRRDASWDEMLAMLSLLAFNSDSLYLAAESATDTYQNIRYISDHPSVLGAMGVLPQSRLVDPVIMSNTLGWIIDNWNWDKTWGWDYPMVAMCAARLGLPDMAVDALLMPCRTNTYLANGHNFQDGRLRVYLPGNGGLLTAVAMMLAGWDGSVGHNPGFPRDWDIRWEGLSPMP